MATNPNLEGDGTALLVANRLGDAEIRITRLARGLASGSTLEFANRDMLADAISGRQPFLVDFRTTTPWPRRSCGIIVAGEEYAIGCRRCPRCSRSRVRVEFRN